MRTMARVAGFLRAVSCVPSVFSFGSRFVPSRRVRATVRALCEDEGFGDRQGNRYFSETIELAFKFAARVGIGLIVSTKVLEWMGGPNAGSQID
jgi:hypothetical protein